MRGMSITDSADQYGSQSSSAVEDGSQQREQQSERAVRMVKVIGKPDSSKSKHSCNNLATEMTAVQIAHESVPDEYRSFRWAASKMWISVCRKPNSHETRGGGLLKTEEHREEETAAWLSISVGSMALLYDPLEQQPSPKQGSMLLFNQHPPYQLASRAVWANPGGTAFCDIVMPVNTKEKRRYTLLHRRGDMGSGKQVRLPCELRDRHGKYLHRRNENPCVLLTFTLPMAKELNRMHNEHHIHLEMDVNQKRIPPPPLPEKEGASHTCGMLLPSPMLLSDVDFFGRNQSENGNLMSMDSLEYQTPMLDAFSVSTSDDTSMEGPLSLAGSLRGGCDPSNYKRKRQRCEMNENWADSIGTVTLKISRLKQARRLTAKLKLCLAESVPRNDHWMALVTELETLLDYDDEPPLDGEWQTEGFFTDGFPLHGSFNV